jgi:hypothetical protein
MKLFPDSPDIGDDTASTSDYRGYRFRKSTLEIGKHSTLNIQRSAMLSVQS